MMAPWGRLLWAVFLRFEVREMTEESVLLEAVR
jgi:hypothetical protein